ncbi:threonine synthase [Alteromonas mediterranea]|uniref:Threonine synthase n=3 Tax=Alteromonas mediterranea TaxID=314275 RepID=S5AGE9_9ALTE|nr:MULTISPECIES: threonine synthase [Alteromonas]AGP78940.1 threonine synthase [Alteromonas mediterranea 615]MBR9785242.1 threonine synthase [Gammaproteobacteria bacterium]MEA3379973.1 threonine synthase [Pseudomonadota bacterium]AEA99226.1 threonine synthase [Alteromonas mediterranea DE]AGP82866.1 threonine synthase [Alteromonas mediterranea MED64]
MELVNLKDSSDTASFAEAVKRGLGKNQGLYFPEHIPTLDNIDELLEKPFVERSIDVLRALIGDELNNGELEEIVKTAFAFGAPVEQVNDNVYSLELFHGPTLAFKDFGGRFMAQTLSRISEGKPVTILTATSGDTGAAVAHAFHGIDNINVVILFPKGKISALQEKLFTTLGGNIHTVAIESDFDACQSLVKTAFDDPDVREGLHLNSANSINISRLLAQVCYYFEAVSQLPKEKRDQLVISVPSGNFGNLTAGMIAKSLGLPIKRFIAATNLNDTVPRYLKTGEWDPKATVATMSNAMDVSQPNNWPRIEALIERGYIDKACLKGEMVDEEYTQLAMRQLAQQGYTSEPHAAIAYRAVSHDLQDGEIGLFLGTAHPAKFRETVENVLGNPISLPKPLADVAGEDSLAVDLPASYDALKQHMMNLLK